MTGQWLHWVIDWLFFEPITMHPIGLIGWWMLAVEFDHWRLRRKAKGGNR